ncbi:hypothetical protein ANCCAN_19879 [Ancylostoma caninum]|uniref:Lipid-binding serum glycoprotein N-terminal domain-containing protein n=1 Tax=Ancylostoma caninum TaxID=29170 RepID=A0A368FPX6_ANCCA|nr:hypothetical protein ANCCAN_19879 [Ancylostoma caninum]
MSAQYRCLMKASVKASFVPEATGVIKVKSESAIVKVILKWNDFSFIPNISVHSNVSVDFDNRLWRFGFLTSRIQEMVTSKVNSDIRRMIAGAVEQQLNPLLQKLKQKLTIMGYTNIEWRVQDKLPRVVLKPKNWKAAVIYKEPSNSMLCLNGIMPSLIEGTKNRVEGAAVGRFGRFIRSYF